MKKIIIAICLIMASSTVIFADVLNFDIPSNTDTGSVRKLNSSIYPPNTTATVLDYGYGIQAQKYNNSGSYTTIVGLLRFDTSGIQDGATITDAKLYLYCSYGVNQDSRNLNIEYYNFSSVSESDYIDDVGTNAANISLTITNNATKEITLSNPNSYISKTGYTGFRMGVSGGQTTNGYQDVVIFNGRDYTNHIGRLVVTYTPSSPPGAPGNPTFTNVANKSMTISWTAATGATSYTLQRGGSNISTSATSPYDDTGLAVNTSYTYRVIAVNSDGSTNCAADQSQTTTYYDKSFNGSGAIKTINGVYVDTLNGQN